MRTKKGIVSSAKMTGTVSVTVHRHMFHPIYKKRYRVSKKFLADSNGHDLYVGDEVIIAECRPLSKNKCFKVTEITKAAPRVDEVQNSEATEKVMHRKDTKDVEKELDEQGTTKATDEQSVEDSSKNSPESSQ